MMSALKHKLIVRFWKGLFCEKEKKISLLIQYIPAHAFGFHI